jgi:hypothetical protein
MLPEPRYVEPDYLPRNGRERAEFGATLTFENADEKTLTLAYTGIAPRVAVVRACEVALDLDETFRVVSISTPSTIHGDLYGREIRHGRANLQEGATLKAAGWGFMLHDRIAERNDERWSV